MEHGIRGDNMNWRKEQIPKLNKEKQVKKYIKGELMNYYLYLEKVKDLKIQKRLNDEISDNPPIGGSFAKMPDGSTSRDGQPHRIAINKCKIESELNFYQNKLDTLDNWMNILTKPLYDVVKVYVMMYQCENMHEASIELSFTAKYEEDTINKYTKRAVDRIYSKVNKII